MKDREEGGVKEWAGREVVVERSDKRGDGDDNVKE